MSGATSIYIIIVFRFQFVCLSLKALIFIFSIKEKRIPENKCSEDGILFPPISQTFLILVLGLAESFLFSWEDLFLLLSTNLCIKEPVHESCRFGCKKKKNRERNKADKSCDHLRSHAGRPAWVCWEGNTESSQTLTRAKDRVNHSVTALVWFPVWSWVKPQLMDMGPCGLQNTRTG